MTILRSGLKPFECVSDVVCGQDIAINWGNKIRDLGQSAFERGDTVLSLCGQYSGFLQTPIVGFGWTYMQGDKNENDTLIRYPWQQTERWQLAHPRLHNIGELYQSILPQNNAQNPNGIPIEDPNNPLIKGVQMRLNSFENCGANQAQVLARVRRGRRNNDPNAEITAIANTPYSNNQILRFVDNDNYSLGYEQHIQVWYCQENPSGATFPPIYTLIFDDNDFPIREYTNVSKVVNITPPAVGTSSRDWIMVSVWYSVLFDVLPNAPFWYGSEAWWVNSTEFETSATTAHPDGLLDITVKLFKAC